MGPEIHFQVCETELMFLLRKRDLKATCQHWLRLAHIHWGMLMETLDWTKLNPEGVGPY
jgi:hypothetical protein